MKDVIIHAYVEPDLSDLKENKYAECRNCMMAEETPILEGGEGYLCKASLYDTKTLACFVPKDDCYVPIDYRGEESGTILS